MVGKNLVFVHDLPDHLSIVLGDPCVLIERSLVNVDHLHGADDINVSVLSVDVPFDYLFTNAVISILVERFTGQSVGKHEVHEHLRSNIVLMCLSIREIFRIALELSVERKALLELVRGAVVAHTSQMLFADALSDDCVSQA